MITLHYANRRGSGISRSATLEQATAWLEHGLRDAAPDSNIRAVREDGSLFGERYRCDDPGHDDHIPGHWTYWCGGE